MRIYVTGGVCVEHDAPPRAARFPGTQAALVLTMLAVERGRVRHEILADCLWPRGLPPAWPTNLRSIVSRTRSVLRPAGRDGADAIVTDHQSYRLVLREKDWVDFHEAIRSVHAAESALESARHEDAACAAWVTEAIARRGFHDDADATWLDAQRRRLCGVRIRALTCLAESLSHLGDHAEAVHHAELAVGLDVYREQSHRTLIAAHTAASDRSSATRALHDCEAQLRELGTHPSPATLAAAQTGFGSPT